MVTNRTIKTSKLKRNRYYCVVENGHLCLWSMATNREDSWFRFEYRFGGGGEKRFDRREAKKKGLRCMRLFVETEEE